MSTSTGKRAEQTAADYLNEKGYEVICLNWRTRMCEIDIIARKDSIIYFAEVKYRRHNHQGTGLEYITPSKLSKMQFAAEIWVNSHQWVGDYRLLAIEVSGDGFDVTNFVEAV